METATPPRPVEHHNAAAPQVEAIDPERDIDAKSTSIWLVTSLVFVVVTLWVLGLTFDFTIRGEHALKIDGAPRKELMQTRSHEADWLDKKAGDEVISAALMPTAEVDQRLSDADRRIQQATDQVISGYLNK
ncbi:MAG: hypothetical protein AAF628_06570 [Planctomycetota bacterium]